MRAVLLVLVVIAVYVTAQDPAQGWLGYAKCVAPGAGIITKVEATWKVGQNPKTAGCFFSPWFGIETSDNLNLIQPVNPWADTKWEIYNEYFQWVPTHNENSGQHTVKAGDVVYGSVTYLPSSQSYMMYHSDQNDGWSVNTTIPIQKSGTQYKNYTIVYFVMEKVCTTCSQYPPDDIVMFYNLNFEYNNKKVTPTCTTAFVDNTCNNRAKVNTDGTIQITWSSTFDEEPVSPLNKDKVSAFKITPTDD